MSDGERGAMRRALELAQTPGVPLGPNPRVGCVLLAPDGSTVAEGFHRGAGTPHAEADALTRAGEQARGATAVVSLEPCNHTGRTGPCADALVAAGVARVVFAQADTSAAAAGGARTLLAAGIDVEGGLLAQAARAVNPAWSFALEHARPYVTWKLATTVDGRSAAPDGSSRWVSSEAARRDTHRLRGYCDAILVGTGTLLADDPRLTVRDVEDVDLPRAHQPLRAVMGLRPTPAGSRVLDDAAPTVLLRTRDPHEAVATLFEHGCRHVFLEGGPTLAAAFLTAGLVDEVVAYVAPLLLGSGRSGVGDLGARTLADAVGLRLEELVVVGSGAEANARLTMTPLARQPAGGPPLPTPQRSTPTAAPTVGRTR